MVVYTTNQHEYLPVATKIANCRDERVITNLNKLEENETVVYVEDPSDIDSSTLHELQKRQLKKKGGSGNFGIITGYTPDLAEKLYFEDTHSNDEHYMFLRKNTENFTNDKNLTVVEDGEATVDRLQEANNSCSLTILTSGWPIHIYLADGYLCGFPESQSLSDYSAEMQPYCVSNGEKDCPLSGELLPAEDANASHMFVDSCASLIDNQTTGLPVHVGMGLLNGVDSLIGAYRVAFTTPYDVILHYSLLRAGYSASERVYIMNQCASTIKSKSYPYVAFGLPESRLPGSSENQETVSIDKTDGKVNVEIEDINTHAIDFQIPFRYLKGASHQGSKQAYIRCVSDVEDPVLYGCFKQNDYLRVIIYSGGCIERDALSIDISLDPIRADHRDIISDSAHNSQSNEMLGITDNRTKEQMENLRNRVSSLSSHYLSERYNASEHSEVSQKLDDIVGDVENIQNEIRYILGKNAPPFLNYASKVVEESIESGDKVCDLCSRPIFVNIVSDTTQSVRRAIGVCPHCGYRFDAPVHEDVDKINYPQVTKHPSEGSSKYRKIEIYFQNPHDEAMLATFFPWLSTLDISESGIDDYFVPCSKTIQISPNSNATVEFKIDIGNLQTNQYYIYSHVIANLSVYAGIDNLIVGDSTGFMPRYRGTT